MLWWLTHVFDADTQEKANGHCRVFLADGHGSHLTLEFINYARQANIMVLCYPTPTTHLLHGLDVVASTQLECIYACHVKTFEADPAVLFARTTLGKSLAMHSSKHSLQPSSRICWRPLELCCSTPAASTRKSSSQAKPYLLWEHSHSNSQRWSVSSWWHLGHCQQHHLCMPRSSTMMAQHCKLILLLLASTQTEHQEQLAFSQLQITHHSLTGKLPTCHPCQQRDFIPALNWAH